MADGSRTDNNDDRMVPLPTIARMNDSSTPTTRQQQQQQEQQRLVPPTRGTSNGSPLGGAAGTAGGGGGFGVVGGFDGVPTNMNNNNWNATTNAEAIWRERERRQRTVRFLMMFLLMLLLMDGEEQQQRERQRRSNNNGDYSNNNGNLRQGGNSHNVKGLHNSGDSYLLDPTLYQARRTQDEMVEEHLWQHPRFQHLLNRNEGKDIEMEIRQWSEQRVDLEKDEFGAVVAAPPEVLSGNVGGGANGESSGLTLTSSSSINAKTGVDPAEEKKAWHYPWNATGFYRGEWIKEDEEDKQDTITDSTIGDDIQKSTTLATATLASSQLEGEKDTSTQEEYSASSVPRVLNPSDMELAMIEILSRQQDPTMGVHLLPPGIELRISNITTSRGNDLEQDGNTVASSRMRNGASTVHQSPFLRGATSNTYNSLGTTNSRRNDDATDGSDGNSNANREAKITLTKTSGRAALQLYSRTVPAMKELSIIDGFVKLYDSNTVGYSTRRDILLRVHGVLIHSLGRISLVANTHSAGRAALVIRNPVSSAGKGTVSTDDARDLKSQGRRRLLERIPGIGAEINETNLAEIRQEALRLFYDDALLKVPSQRISSFEDDFKSLNGDIIHSKDEETERRRLDEAGSDEEESTTDGGTLANANEATSEATNDRSSNTTNATHQHFVYSKYVVPYPFAWDDGEQSLQRNRIPSTARSMPPREQLLEANAGSCEFEINMVVQEEEWTIGQWRTLLTKHLNQISQLDPTKRRHEMQEFDAEAESSTTSNRGSKRKKKKGAKPLSSKSQRATLEQALVMTINGTISSLNCNFAAHINATAIRTDWEHTTGKAINYSFYMMVTCLTQIVLLLRQLLHTQAQSAATRVSLLCIGWQTVVDALLCLVHIYLSLAMQPLFTAFASVAFFKLLIFCVIEMKYMAIIIQARNASNGGNTIELLRRQIAMLHLRFYVALMVSCLGFFYSGETYRTAYILLLYSFWVPQIIHNIVTEAKRPLHTYYVYGMSLSRLVAPIYIFAFQNNFLKEVYPESPTNVLMCQLLVLWVGFQAGVLEAQGRYGARFMIPARFLPPKFDYNRPIPASLLPRGIQTVNPSEELQNERASPTTEVRSVVPKREVSPRGGGARNRMKGNRSNRSESGMTAETVTAAPKNPDLPHFDCVICYNEIDITNRTGYMLAPCDHIFHKDCLVQWMEVKMECPICRTTLPAI